MLQNIFFKLALFLVVKALEVAAFVLAKLAVPDIHVSRHPGYWLVTSKKYADCYGKGEDKLLAIADFIGAVMA